MKIKFYGHSCFALESDNKTILIDPFFTGNPVAGSIPPDLRPDLILVTHGHGDHLGDAVEISKKTETPILAIFELANLCNKKGAKTIGVNMGGKVFFEFGWVKMVPAWHSSSTPDGIYAGEPGGFIIKFYDRYIYHAGDTSLFSDMKLIGQEHPLDVAMLPIGGYFTMDPEDAISAVKLLNPKSVIPMHYNTFDLIKQDPASFEEHARTQGRCKCIILQPQDEYSLPPSGVRT